jgi:hypothetical protein
MKSVFITIKLHLFKKMVVSDEKKISTNIPCQTNIWKMQFNFNVSI